MIHFPARLRDTMQTVKPDFFANVQINCVNFRLSTGTVLIYTRVHANSC